ncbi:hypothetical protein [Holospora undulata]|uniref:Uncharacterized protein n=1 Tax=Holospora undulata HU1 TaxID=1321371 RepID=A0A061JFT7_9PROT|nr:hypothetical protein [Holospora undulata]ETZ04586.1 hypothetical protein K737_301003 [Holospora undulata HU1]
MLHKSKKILLGIFLLGIAEAKGALEDSDSILPLEETEKYVPDINTQVLDDLTALPGSSKEPGQIISCKDMILKMPVIPNDPDVNLVYVNTYTWCMMQAVLKTFLEAHKKSTNIAGGKQEILDALSTLSSFLPALLLAYHYSIPSFSAGLREKLIQEQTEIQRNFPEMPTVPEPSQ